MLPIVHKVILTQMFSRGESAYIRTYLRKEFRIKSQRTSVLRSATDINLKSFLFLFLCFFVKILYFVRRIFNIHTKIESLLKCTERSVLLCKCHKQEFGQGLRAPRSLECDCCQLPLPTEQTQEEADRYQLTNRSMVNSYLALQGESPISVSSGSQSVLPSSAAPGNFEKCEFSGSSSHLLNQKLWARGPETWAVTSHPGDSSVCSILRNTDWSMTSKGILENTIKPQANSEQVFPLY